MKKIIITAGGTSERIDNVRKITNSSSGKLGMTIANNLILEKKEEIEKIYYICSKNSYRPNDEKIEIIEIFDTEDLEMAITELLTKENIDIFIHSMAVSDYTVDYITTSNRLAKYIEENDGNIEDLIINNQDVIKENKVSSYEENLIIKLKKTKKIISIIKDLSKDTFLVGFKLLDGVSEQELLETAIKLKDKNNCDLVIANDLQNIREGVHKAFIIDKENEYEIATGKDDISKKLVKTLFK